jgi:hypothetical protein
LFEKGSKIIEIKGIVGVLMVAVRRRMVEEIILRRREVYGVVSCCSERVAAGM